MNENYFMTVSRRRHSRGRREKTFIADVLPIILFLVFMSVLITVDIKVALGMKWPINFMLMAGPFFLIIVFIWPVAGIGMLIMLVYVDALQRVQGTQFSAVKIVFAITVFSSLIIFLMKKINRPRTPVDIPIVLYGFAIFFTMFFGHNSIYHINIVIRVATFIIITLLMPSLIKDEKTLKIILYIMILGSLISAGVGLMQFVTGGEVVTKIYPDRGYGGVANTGVEAQYVGRATGMTLNANHYAFMLMIVLPFIMAIPHTFKVEKESPFRKFLLTGTLYVLCAGIVLSQSRATLICTALILGFMTLLAPGKYKVRYAVLYLFLPLMVGLFVLFGMGLYQRNDIEDDPSVSIRLNDNLIVRDIILDRPGLLLKGAGFGGYARIAPPYQTRYGVERLPVLHSDYIRTLFEFGVFPFFSLILLWLVALFSSYRAYHSADEDKKYMILAFSMALISIVIFIFFHTEMFGAGAWYIIGLFSTAHALYCGAPASRKKAAEKAV